MTLVTINVDDRAFWVGFATALANPKIKSASKISRLGRRAARGVMPSGYRYSGSIFSLVIRACVAYRRGDDHARFLIAKAASEILEILDGPRPSPKAALEHSARIRADIDG